MKTGMHNLPLPPLPHLPPPFAARVHMGNMTKDFVPVGKEEQAEVKVSMVMVTRSSDLIFLCLRMRPILIRLLNFSASTVYPFLIALSIFHPFS